MLPLSGKNDLLSIISDSTNANKTDDLRRRYMELRNAGAQVCKSVLNPCNVINMNSTFNALDLYRQRLKSIQEKVTPFPFSIMNIHEKCVLLNDAEEERTTEVQSEKSVTPQPANVAAGNEDRCCVSAGNCQYFSIHESTNVTFNSGVSENREKGSGTPSPSTDEGTKVERNSSFTIEESLECRAVKNVEEASNLPELPAPAKVTSSRKVSATLSKKIEKTNDSDNRPYRCSICNRAFKRNLHLKRHFLVTHTKSKNFNCNICGRSFSRKDYLDKHIAGHEKKNFKLKLLQQGIVVRTKMNVKTNNEKS